MRITTLIPIHLNDGTPVPDDDLQGILKRFFELSEGVTVDGTVDGQWQDAGRIYSDRCWKVVVATDGSSEKLQQAETLVIEIGRQLQQKAMYFEVQYFDGVRILPVE